MDPESGSQRAIFLLIVVLDCSMADLTGGVNATYGGPMTWTKWVGLVWGMMLFDQGIRHLVERSWPNWVVTNRAALFGLLQQPWAIAIVIGLAVFVLWHQRQFISQGSLLAFALALIVAGGLSNILDRVLTGGVIDYLPIPGWFTFNLADAEITVGTAIFIWLELIRGR